MHTRTSKKSRVRGQRFIRQYKHRKKCRGCGSTSQLTFHHVNPATKKYDMSEAIRMRLSISTLKKEIKKCIVLCRKCHDLEHNNVMIPPPSFFLRDFEVLTLTNNGFRVIITYKPTGLKYTGWHHQSRRLAHNIAVENFVAHNYRRPKNAWSKSV